MKRITWLKVLRWAVNHPGPFSTSELAVIIELEKAKDRSSYANTLTQKLWKWGYLKKTSGDGTRQETRAAKQNAVDQRVRTNPIKGRGGPGRGQGRRPAVWVVTPKGVRRAKRKGAKS